MRKKKVFVSYSSQQGPWVWDRLVPCLKAGGAEALIDRERFEAGKTVVGQMDATQDEADRHVLVLSPDYLASKFCKHEMDRAIALDPAFAKGIVLPVLRVDCKLPTKIAKPNPLYIDLRNDTDAAPWDKLMRACGADLGCDAAHWLEVRDEVRQHLRNNRSVSLVVQGKPKWRELIDNLRSKDDPKGRIPELANVDLESGAAVSRPGLVTEIIRVLGGRQAIPPAPEDLVELDRFIGGVPRSHLVLRRFDHVAHRPHYGTDLFSTLRNLVTDKRKLVLLIQSRAPLPTLLPADHPMSSSFTSLQTVELRGRS